MLSLKSDIRTIWLVIMNKFIKTTDQLKDVLNTFKFDWISYNTEEYTAFAFYNAKLVWWDDETQQLCIESKDDSRTLPLKFKTKKLICVVLDDKSVQFQLIIKK